MISIEVVSEMKRRSETLSEVSRTAQRSIRQRGDKFSTHGDLVVRTGVLLHSIFEHWLTICRPGRKAIA